MTQRYLIDKSALARWGKPGVEPMLDSLNERGLLISCGAVEYEVLYSARNKAEALRLRTMLRSFDYLPMNDEIWDRALKVQSEAMNAGFHRALSLTDLLIAATAERYEVTVLHYDGDYDMIASVTGQATQWVAEPGTAD
ncbi:PIN domain nuclease [Streptomyces gobiensis]|uniref:PIN domain nuclease n=1 Tax=Streptomyces gobiensis TaxID=2875706 RepID=UPI001E625EFF|nr:PIN domain nuclease [Streptomyces gobiensis]UGY92609.1 PIN domain nuclease [Streptomyces gobiensis]